MPAVPRPSLRRALLGAAAALLATGALVATPAPSYAGQVGVTPSVRGAGSVVVVEGSLEDGAGTTCNRDDNQDQRVTVSCPRVRNEEPFEATVWLRAVPAPEPAGQWVFYDWTGCDTRRTVEGHRECGVRSGAFSSEERYPTAIFKDNTPPTVTGLQAATVTGQRGRIRVTWSTDGIRSQCYVGSPVFRDCTSGFAEYYAAGDHTVHVRSEDPSGNWSAEATATFTVVDTQIHERPPALTNAAVSSFLVSTNGGTEVQCSLDGRPWSTCVRGTAGHIRLIDLDDGPHRLEVAGRKGTWADQQPVGWTWRVDTVAPQTRLTAQEVTGRSATFSFESESGDDTSECRLSVDGVAGAWTACTSPVAYDGLRDGAHLFEVRGTDLAGNLEAEPAYHAWGVDATPPQTTLRGGPSAFTLDPTARFTLGASGEPGASASCTLDGRARACAPGEVVLTGLAPGTHVLTAAATDAAGNTDPSAATRSWTVPLTAKALTRGRGWTLRTSRASYGRSYAQATRRGATLTRKVAGARRLALVVGGGRGHGAVRVYAGTRLVGTVRLASSRTVARRVVVLPALRTAYTGTVRVVSTSDRPARVEGLGVATR